MIKSAYSRRAYITFVSCCIAVLSAYSEQVTVNLRLNYEKALMFEPVIATVHIANRSGRLLTFGGKDAPELLDFLVTRDNGVMVRKRETWFIPATHILPGERKATALDITSLYELNKNAEYRIQAILKTDMGPFASTSERLVLEKGFALARMSVGVPGTHDVSTYTLEYLKRDRAEFIYLSIKDEKADIVYGVFNLGRLVRIRKPTLISDESGNAHVLFESLNASVYTAFTPYGVQLFAEIHPKSGERIILRQTQEGSVRISKEASVDGNTIFK